MNSFLSFYTQNNISPVRQDITNIESHISRRISLYRELGVLKNFISNSDILEVGPGGGYNAIVTAMHNPKSYTLVEPNPTGYNEMLGLFERYNLNSEFFTFINNTLENIFLDKQYDLVICEGLIPGLENKELFISKLKQFVKVGGVLIITTADNISIFLEIARRFIANKLVSNEKNIEQKLAVLVEAFSSHLSSLDTSTRPTEDWILDVLLNPAWSNPLEFYSLGDAIYNMKDEFYYLSSSPNLFINPIWYKKLENSPILYNQKYLTQFDSCRHSLILQEAPVTHRDNILNKQLSDLCFRFGVLSRKAEYGEISFVDCNEEVIDICKDIIHNLEDKAIEEILNEFIEVAQDTTIDRVKNMQKFKGAFGKGQQYISFVKC